MSSSQPNAFTPVRMLVTGGAGFIGSNFVRFCLETCEQLKLVVLDALTYAGVPENLAGLQQEYRQRYRFVQGDICDRALVSRLFEEQAFDSVVHFAAESHVDRSIDGPEAFIRTNVEGTVALLQAARTAWQDRTDVRFHHISTDEVFGSLEDDGAFTEDTPYDPSSPYSASKAASDHMARAWHRTFGLPVTISNCSNNYGPRQYPEKLLPCMIFNALAHRPLPVYGDGSNVRDWLYVDDHCRAIDLVLRRGALGRTYNVGGHGERKNLDVVHQVCDILEDVRPSRLSGGYRSLITFVADRPGHDFRYAIDPTRITSELGWKPAESFETGLRKTIIWYLENQDWLQAVIKRNPAAGDRIGLGS